MPTASELRKLILDAETVLRQRRQDTTDPAEKEALKHQIDELRLQKDLVDLADLNERAAILNRLADSLEAAVASLRTRPFDHVLAQLQALFDRVGEASGTAAREVRPQPTADAAPIPGALT